MDEAHIRYIAYHFPRIEKKIKSREFMIERDVYDIVALFRLNT